THRRIFFFQAEDGIRDQPNCFQGHQQMDRSTSSGHEYGFRPPRTGHRRISRGEGRMTTSDSIEHTSFVVERELSTSPRHAFRFWSEAELKARWSGCHPDWVVLEDRFDFRAGGMEAKRWRTPDGDEQTFHAHYLDL